MQGWMLNVKILVEPSIEQKEVSMNTNLLQRLKSGFQKRGVHRITKFAYFNEDGVIDPTHPSGEFVDMDKGVVARGFGNLGEYGNDCYDVVYSLFDRAYKKAFDEDMDMSPMQRSHEPGEQEHSFFIH